MRERDTLAGDTRSPLPELEKGKGKVEDHVKNLRGWRHRATPCTNVQKKGK